METWNPADPAQHDWGPNGLEATSCWLLAPCLHDAGVHQPSDPKGNSRLDRSERHPGGRNLDMGRWDSAHLKVGVKKNQNKTKKLPMSRTTLPWMCWRTRMAREVVARFCFSHHSFCERVAAERGRWNILTSPHWLANSHGPAAALIAGKLCTDVFFCFPQRSFSRCKTITLHFLICLGVHIQLNWIFALITIFCQKTGIEINFCDLGPEIPLFTTQSCWPQASAVLNLKSLNQQQHQCLHSVVYFFIFLFFLNKKK